MVYKNLRVTAGIDEDTLFLPFGVDICVRVERTYHNTFYHVTFTIDHVSRIGKRFFMEQLLLPAAVAILFYLLIPGVGAFGTRAKWRWFRKSITEISLRPEVTYATLRKWSNGVVGNYRIIGNLQAIQGENIMWLKNKRVSVAVELAGEDVFVLPVPEQSLVEDGVEQYDQAMAELMPRRVPWNSIFSLPEGTELLISGALHVEDGEGVFRSTGDTPLLVVIFEGKPETIVPRSIWVGRQKNEYWNRATPISIAAGSFALFIIAYTLFKVPLLRMQAIITVTLSLFPLIPFFPPGVFFFFLYRYLWKRGRILRAERDLFRLPLRYFAEGVDAGRAWLLPNGEPYGVKRFTSCREAREVCGGGAIRTSILLGRQDVHTRECRVYGVPDNGKVIPPSDPLSELVFIPGDPEELAYICNGRARRMEILSGLSFLVGFLGNSVLLLLLISVLVR